MERPKSNESTPADSTSYFGVNKLKQAVWLMAKPIALR